MPARRGNCRVAASEAMGQKLPNALQNTVAESPLLGVQQSVYIFLRAASGTCRSLRGKGSGGAVGKQKE